MNFVEKTSTYKELRQDYELQCMENGRKQDRILELSRKVREQEERIKELETMLQALQEPKKRGRKKND